MAPLGPEDRTADPGRLANWARGELAVSRIDLIGPVELCPGRPDARDAELRVVSLAVPHHLHDVAVPHDHLGRPARRPPVAGSEIHRIQARGVASVLDIGAQEWSKHE